MYNDYNEQERTLDSEYYYTYCNLSDFYCTYKDYITEEDKIILYNFSKLMFECKDVYIYLIDKVFDDDFIEPSCQSIAIRTHINPFELKVGSWKYLLNSMKYKLLPILKNNSNYNQNIYLDAYNMIKRYIDSNLKIDYIAFLRVGYGKAYYEFLKEFHEKNCSCM